jgi:hypothetical protein
MPSAITQVPSASGTATAQRRGAQVSRGAAMNDQTIGAPISTPSVSPIHQAAHVPGTEPVPIVPLPQSIATATVALVVQASGTTPSMKRARSAGSDSCSGCDTQRRTIQAPSAACSAAPAEAPSQVTTTAAVSALVADTSQRLATSAAAPTAATAQ